MRAVCPGSFDPITRGHLDIIVRAASVFSEVIVAVGRNTTKNYMFDVHERLGLVTDAVSEMANVRVALIDGLLVDFCAAQGAKVIVKGVRFGSDFDYELQMSQLNRQLSGIETALLPAGREFGTISSSMLREVAHNGADISAFVTDAVNRAVLAKVGR
ncbi:pantetheine-phosphate adenylyltransferase [Brooklawnia sp.]|uniref:pantetheine-phosphate adenylyltransferase n=1 Tax=Brooklawnia sp. TaxID=2699740 RepID=UPI00311D5FA0